MFFFSVRLVLSGFLNAILYAVSIFMVVVSTYESMNDDFQRRGFGIFLFSCILVQLIHMLIYLFQRSTEIFMQSWLLLQLLI